MKDKIKLHVELSLTKERITAILDDVSNYGNVAISATELIGRRNKWFKNMLEERLKKEIKPVVIFTKLNDRRKK